MKFLALCILATASFTAAQFSNKTVQPLCNSNFTMDCSNFAPADGSFVMGWNVDFDRHDTIKDMVARMEGTSGPSFAATHPGAYGLFMKIGIAGLVGQQPLDPINKEDLDTVLEQMKGTNAIFVTSLDPNDGYANVKQADVELFADKLAEYNRYGIPVLVRPGHEMNAPWYPFGFQPSKFKAFYINVYNTVKRKAPYVKFIFAPNIQVGYPWSGTPPAASLTAADIAEVDTNGNGAIDAGDDPYTPYYPGDEYVDWMGFSMYWKGDYPYNVNQAQPADFIAQQLNTRTATAVSSYEFARLRNLPIIFPEMAGTFTASNGGVSNIETKRQFWIDVFGPTMQQRFPLLKMGLWFDYSKFEDNQQRDFSISNRNATTGASSIDEVAPIFKADIATYPHLVYSSSLSLSASGDCGCFRYSANALALGESASPTTGNVVSSVASATTKTQFTVSPTSAGINLRANGMLFLISIFMFAILSAL